MGCSADQRRECLVCRQGSKQRYFPREFRGRLGRIQGLYTLPPARGGVWALTRVSGSDFVKGTPKGEVREEQSQTPGAWGTTAVSFHVLYTTQYAHPFPSNIKGSRMRLSYTQ